MKKIITVLILFCFFNSTYSQIPGFVKQWDKRFGGINYDVFLALSVTTDGGYVLAGYSLSDSSGDKTQHTWGGNDYWIVKIDSIGFKEWDKRFGGTGNEFLFSFQQTNDHGYILGGSSNSGINGDKSQPNWDSINSTADFWIIKIDSIGNKQWDKRYGGIGEDYLRSLEQTNDHGYILGGYSKSPISGDKTEPNWDTTNYFYDFWIVKIDSIGNKQWDKRFGGTSYEYLTSLHQTNDNGYILGGYSYSGISGDKTQPSWGSDDYWIVKVDSLGNKQWDKRYGGTGQDDLYFVQLNNDQGYILGGYVNSPISGDITQANWDTTNGTYDFWLIDIDSSGNKQWDKRFGGTNQEELNYIFKTNDKGYLISGDSYSNSSGDKTENNLGLEQAWIVKTDSLFNKQWDKTIFTTGHDELAFAIQNTDGCYAIANCVVGGIGGYKTQPNWDTTNVTADYWIVKFCDTTSITGVNLFSGLFSVSIYPNPFSSDVSITIHKQNLNQVIFTIKNVLGQPIFSKQERNLSNTYSKTIDLSFLSEGIYLLDVNIDGERTVKKFVKE